MSKEPLPSTRLDPEAHTQEWAEIETGAAPPFRAPGACPEPASRSEVLPDFPTTGQVLLDFELLRELGAGSFARVYLARQVSLGRLVALKVSRNRGQEARTLANLEHDHIVRVFSESIEFRRDLRLLCMQYVAGTTLERLIDLLKDHPRQARDGKLLLDLIDHHATDPAALDLGALRDRQALAEMDLLEAGCWMGARLAEALAHAHGLGVLHRDIKPANILVNRYGRPLLADFNIASAPVGSEPGEQLFGGTIAYMAPEHLDAFNTEDFTSPQAVDVRSDIWSLGAVLYELFTGEFPYPLPPLDGPANQCLRQLSDQRRQSLSGGALPKDLPPPLQRILLRCLDPLPSRRYQNAADLAADLDSCREWRRLQRELPPGRWLTQWCLQAPFLLGVFLLLFPQLIGSMVNIKYNDLRIVRQLSDAQQAFFYPLVWTYNALCYPLIVAIFISRVVPVYRAWTGLGRGDPMEAATVEDARKRALRLPDWLFGLACVGWFLGGVLFPLLISWRTEWLSLTVFGHFLFSFTISGLIAITYSVLAAEFLVLRVLYPALWLDARQLPQLARQELQHADARLHLLQFGAVLIPIAGAALMVGVGPEVIDSQSYRTFRLLVTALLSIGMVGLGLALLAGSELRQVLGVFISLAHQRNHPERRLPGTDSRDSS